MHPTSRLLFVLAAAVLLAGCGASGDDIAASEPPIEVRPVSSSAQIELPLARYLMPAADEKAYFAAVNVAQKQCAREYGVESTMPAADQPSQLELASARRYGVLNVDEVARYGYAPVPTGEGNDKIGGWNPSAEEAVVLNGVDTRGNPIKKAPNGEDLPEGGCGAEGHRRIADEPSAVRPELVQRLLTEAWDLMLADSRAQAATAEWSACMAEHGYDFEHRWDAGNSVGGKPQEVQVQMAVLDLECARTTEYLDVWHAVDRAFQERLIEAHEGELQAILEQYRQIMERVRATLDGR